MEALYRSTIETQLGVLTALTSESGLCALEFDEVERQENLSKRLLSWFPNHSLCPGGHPVLEQTRSWLDLYFAGSFGRLERLPLDLRGTDFELQVWNLLLEIPVGSTARYGELAIQLNRRLGARAVGLATGRNPVAIVVPCHRVVGADGSLTGYGGGIERKRWLLGHECFAAPGLFSAAATG